MNLRMAYRRLSNILIENEYKKYMNFGRAKLGPYVGESLFAKSEARRKARLDNQLNAKKIKINYKNNS